MVTNFCCASEGVAVRSGAPSRATARYLSFMGKLPLWRSKCANRPYKAGSDRVRKRRVDGRAEPFHDFADKCFIDDKRGRDKHMIAARAVDRAAHRIDEEAARHRLRLDPGVELPFRIERFP